MSDQYFISEVSWEVANKVGGIYTVLSSRAGEMIHRHGAEQVLFVGPRLRPTEEMVDFRAETFCITLPSHISLLGVELPITQGYWLTPGGEAQTILVDYKPLATGRDQLYYLMWERYGIQSELGYGDYDESCLFAVAAAATLLAVTPQLASPGSQPIAIYNEWITGMGLLYHHLEQPDLRSLFITHATTVGRSICSNGKDLYRYFSGYHGDQMASELHVEAKHALEKAAAHTATIFATVSEVTALECTQLLERTPIVLPNGFDSLATSQNQSVARQRLLDVASRLYGKTFAPERTTLVATSGRYEYRNKGIDLIVASLESLLQQQAKLSSDLILYFFIPAWVAEPRADLAYLLSDTDPESGITPLQYPYLTHWLHNLREDTLARRLGALLERGATEQRIYPIFVPTYLDGHDGILDLPYYDLLSALDLTLFPSYYEPWGYTPLESIAYGVPTVTTDLSGFGQAILELYGEPATDSLQHGVQVIPRRDYDDAFVTKALATILTEASCGLPTAYHEQARETASHALWRLYYDHYMLAYRQILTS
ncbi:MAG: glycosyltransferase [Porphyromonas sp.]|uniref:glycosyltransferase n=1 Tax=Porphyromonas sp. TaxID=1924944 RepID=UPI001A42E299|nr:glycosyltransferase [Porphyromonas sp.]MBL6452535.1 glycosyltransferase [Porphyromonas sp.]